MSLNRTTGGNFQEVTLNKENMDQPQWRNLGTILEPLKLEAALSPRQQTPQTSRNPRPRTESSNIAPITEPRHTTYKSWTTRHTDKKFFGAELQITQEPTKCSVKENGIVKAYAANTNQGIVRNYNEDRVSIILNIMKPPSRSGDDWPRCSFFGVYDGHGGSACADFLRDNLHQFVIKDPNFPSDPKKALRGGFEAAEKAFLEQSIKYQPHERSGSCGIVLLIVRDICYVANVGDSRGIMSGELGAKIYPLTRDHKPNDEKERKRIIEAGGKVYQSQAQIQGISSAQKVVGPYRVFPGRLSVSRTFGDIEAKLPSLGGNPEVLISVPEIKAFRVTTSYDFIILASDGVFDKMTNREVIQKVWDSVYSEEILDVHRECGKLVEAVLREALMKRSLDNVTVVMIAFENFQRKIDEIRMMNKHV